MAGNELSCQIERQDDAAIVSIAGEIDILTAPDVSKAVNQALAASPRLLVIDLTQVDFLASAGLAALINAQHQASSEQAGPIP